MAGNHSTDLHQQPAAHPVCPVLQRVLSVIEKEDDDDDEENPEGRMCRQLLVAQKESISCC